MVAKFAIGFVIFLALGAVALAMYGARVEPPKQAVEQVLPDSRFPK